MKTLVKILMMIVAVLALNVLTAKAQIVDTIIQFAKYKNIGIETTNFSNVAHVFIKDTVTNKIVFDSTIVNNTDYDLDSIYVVSDDITNTYFIQNKTAYVKYYRIIITNVSAINTYSNVSGKEKITNKIYDLLGQEIAIENIKPYVVYIYTYIDSSYEKKMMIK